MPCTGKYALLCTGSNDMCVNEALFAKYDLICTGVCVSKMLAEKLLYGLIWCFAKCWLNWSYMAKMFAKAWLKSSYMV
jgi:hypothetical protein